MDELNRPSLVTRWTLTGVLLSIGLSLVIIGDRLDNRTIGLFHDDGIYVAVAKGLAEGKGHRIVSLPGEPRQTKYPPLYSVVLAAVWKAAPDFPDNIRWFKRLNVLFVLGALVGTWFWTRDHLRPVTAVLLVAVVGLSPGVVSFSDYAMTDIPFLTLVVLYCYLWHRAAQSDTSRLHVLIAGVSTLAVLTRSVGIAMIAASVVACLWRRQWRHAAFHAVVPGFAFGAWIAWAFWNRSAEAGPLVAYYLEYETSAVEHALRDLPLAAQIVYGNLRLAWQTLGSPLGPAWAAWAPLYVLLTLVGAWQCARRPGRVPYLFFAVYVGLIVLHPFSPLRYVLPLVPVVVLFVLVGAESVGAWTASEGRRQIHSSVAGALVALTLAVPMLWLHDIGRRESDDTVLGWYGLDLGYGWSGFEETFRWVRTHTAPDAVLGTMFDGTYYLHTGRQAVRPYIQHAETYFYPLGNAQPFVGDPSDVLAALDDLGTTHIVLDPVTGYAERRVAALMLRELLASPSSGSERVFVSSDGHHEVYRLHATRASGVIPETLDQSAPNHPATP